MAIAGCLALILSSGPAAATVVDPADKAGSSAANTCRGVPATIVGAPTVRVLIGTSGADVIVTGGALSVIAKSGDDLVCVTGRTRRVEAGAGDDVVTTGGGTTQTFTMLGAGADRFMGGARPDDIRPGREGDTAIDRVNTGGGSDSYDDDQAGPNQDLVDLGRGRDFALLDFPNISGHLDGGAGLNTLLMAASFDEPESWVVDNVTEVATVNGEALFGWDNFRGFTFQAGSVEFRASDESEVVKAQQFFEFGPDIESLDMRGGDDQVVMIGMLVPVDGGPGSDWVRAVGFADERSRTPERRVAVDLVRDTLVVNSSRPGISIDGVENVEVDGFGTAVLRGDSQGNELLVGQTCLARMYGLGGPDILAGLPPSRCGANKAEFFGVPRSIIAYGNGGNDLMAGRATQDRLVGGRGADTADGRSGVDTCKAETEYRCERRPET